MNEAEEKAITALKIYGDSRFLDGLRLGVAELQTFIAWMTQQPDTRRQAETRKWMERRVAEIRAKYGIT